MRAALILSLLLPAAALGAETAFQTVTVKPGDTLWAIANKYLQDPARWDEILKYNRLPSSDPTVALPGMNLRVPVRLIKAEKRAAHLVYLVNHVDFRRKETPSWKTGLMKMELMQGDALRTFDQARARVKLLDKELLSLEPNSMAVIKPIELDGDLELKSGSVFAGRARVVTASATVMPKTRDTRYAATIEADLTTRVDVYAGAAAVDAQGSQVEVPAGMSTRVRPGLAPELPHEIENMPELEARAKDFASAVDAESGRAGGAGKNAALPLAPEADASSLRVDLESMRVGQPIMGFRVQGALDREFKQIIFDKKYESEQRLRPEDMNLRPGAYWWRMAIIDLLGTVGNFSTPRYYTVGIKTNKPGTIDLRTAVTISSPAEDSVIRSDKARVAGILRDDRLSLTIAGKPARIDEDGNFEVSVPLTGGRNEIVIVVSDGNGNSSQISRRVTRP